MATIDNVVASLQKERSRLESELGQVRRALDALGHVSGGGGNKSKAPAKKSGRRTLSPEARRRIAEAQRLRWAKVRKQNAKQAK